MLAVAMIGELLMLKSPIAWPTNVCRLGCQNPAANNARHFAGPVKQAGSN